MKSLPSRKRIRWWFRSRHSGYLNSLSYWLCVLIFSVMLALVFSALWRVHVAEQSWYQQASEYADWVYATPPNALKAYNSGQFLAERKELITRVMSGAEIQVTSWDPLESAHKINDLPSDKKQVGSLFGKVESLQVYPSHATYSKTKKCPSPTENTNESPSLAENNYEEPSPTERKIFKSFAVYMTALYNKHKGDINHIENSLAAAFGLTSLKDNPASFDVPWVYVASREGAIAVFPGTNVIAKEKWEITSRPWYMAAWGDSKLFSKGLVEEDLLTVTYLDVLAESPMLVRTYMYKFSADQKEFVICIDLKLRGEEVSGITPQHFDRKPSYNAIFLDALLLKELRPIHYVTFGFTFLLFMIVRWISADRNSKLAFKRTKSLLGKINIEDALRVQRDDLTTKEETLGIEVGKYVFGKVESGEIERNTLTAHTNIEKSRSNLRGFELWEVCQTITTTWRLLWIRFENVKMTYVGTIRLIYNNEISPEADWTLFNNVAFSESEATNLHTKLPTILQENANQCAGYLDIPDQVTEFPSFLYPPSVPDWVRAVVDAKELLAVRQHRAYVRLSSEQIDELYSKSDIKAVMASGYFEQLLNHGESNFLFKGRTISRLISFPDPVSVFNLTEKGEARLKDLVDSYSSSSSRSLKRVNIPISNESVLLPVYDFVILNNSSVIVAHFISLVTGVDNASGKQTKSTYYVEGYMSWRPADIKFYCDLFDQLAAGELKEIDLLQNKAKVL